MKLAGIEIPELDGNKKRILDLGCGPGWTLVEAARQGALTFGTDVSGSLLKEAEKNLESRRLSATLVRASVEKIPFPPASFDAVVCLETIEHTPDTDQSISEISRVLAPAGICLLSFPHRDVENIINAVNPRFMAYSGHVRQFSFSQMTEILARHRLKILRSYRRHFEWSLYWLARACLGQIPNIDRRGDRYGNDVPSPFWTAMDVFYKKAWSLVLRCKIGIPLLLAGNGLLPKSHILVCAKSGDR